MTTMSPQDFHDLFDRAVSDVPPSAHDDLAAGSRLLRRRRIASSVVVVAAVLAVAGGGYAVTGSPSSDSRGVDDTRVATAPHPASEAGMLELCQQGNVSDAAEDALLDAGIPVVRVRAESARQYAAVLESRDGTAWAHCWVNKARQEFKAGMSVYQAEKPDSDGSTAGGWTFGPTCGLVDNDVDPDCRTFFLSVFDRLPEQVAAVRFVTFDDVTTDVPVTDGYLLFEYDGVLPEGVTFDTLADPLRATYYLDESGTPIAGRVTAGEGVGEDLGQVEGLAGLSAYPSALGHEIW